MLGASVNSRVVAALVALATPGIVADIAGAEPERNRIASAEPDRYELIAQSRTYAELFRRALLPGPNGALISRDTVVPLHQYLSLGARDLDSPWHEDSLDLELAAWGGVWLGSDTFERPLDGDVQVANVRYRAHPAWFRLGRQQMAGGAARFTRFDGAALGFELGAGLSIAAYGGLTVLPRWNAEPGYYHLGSAADSLLRDPEALPDVQRSSYWVAGGRLGWAVSDAHVALSMHEQHEPGGISRRNLGLDAQGWFTDSASLGTSALLELDAEDLADFRIWVDAAPARVLDVTLEYQHTDPALLLSRQSVLSVFATDAYDETGGSLALRLTRALSVGGGAWIQLHDDSRPGARGEGVIRLLLDRGRRTLVRLGYARVYARDNGYHSLRTSLARKIVPRLSGTLELYAYFYDEPIRSYDTSKVYAGTLSYQALESLDLLWGASLTQSPYAALDASTLIRVSYLLDASSRPSAGSTPW